MRSFIVLLLLVVVFLTGMLIGIDREQSTHVNNTPSDFNVVEPVDDQITPWEIHEEEQFIVEKQMSNMKEPEQATQKVAAFLEAGVKGFYEVVVEVLFQISSLFI